VVLTGPVVVTLVSFCCCAKPAGATLPATKMIVKNCEISLFIIFITLRINAHAYCLISSASESASRVFISRRAIKM
jgi:hypothetical protein